MVIFESDSGVVPGDGSGVGFGVGAGLGSGEGPGEGAGKGVGDGAALTVKITVSEARIPLSPEIKIPAVYVPAFKPLLGTIVKAVVSFSAKFACCGCVTVNAEVLPLMSAAVNPMALVDPELVIITVIAVCSAYPSTVLGSETVPLLSKEMPYESGVSFSYFRRVG